MKIKISLGAILLFLCSVQIVFAQEDIQSQQNKYPICSDCVTLGKALSLPQPEYPKEAKASNAFGTVTVQITIDEKGNVVDAKGISGNPLFFESSVAAALKTKFTPARTVGSKLPVKSVGVVTYNFISDEPILPKQVQETNQSKAQTQKNNKQIKLAIINGRATNLPEPEYSKAARDSCASGQVKVQVSVDEDGNVTSAEAISGDELLRASAVEAAKNAKFSSPPFRVKEKGIVVYNFIPKIKCIQVGTVNRRAKFLPKPIYPKGCRCQGVIKVRIVVDLDGKVISARADSGNPQLRFVAVQAARKTKFSPSKIDGAPILAVAFLEYKFYSNGKVST